MTTATAELTRQTGAACGRQAHPNTGFKDTALLCRRQSSLQPIAAFPNGLLLERRRDLGESMGYLKDRDRHAKLARNLSRRKDSTNDLFAIPWVFFDH